MSFFQGVLSGHVGDIRETQEYLPAQQGHAGLGFGVPRALGWAGTQMPRDLGMQASQRPKYFEAPRVWNGSSLGTQGLWAPRNSEQQPLRLPKGSGHRGLTGPYFGPTFSFHPGPGGRKSLPGRCRGAAGVGGSRVALAEAPGP